MKKDYKRWHAKKSLINNIPSRPFFHEREVWFSHLGANVGFEQDGVGEQFLRPIVIVKKFNNEIFWGVPTTKKDKKGEFYLRFSYAIGEHTSIILSQLRLVDSKRLFYRIGVMNEDDFHALKKRLTSFLK